MFVCNDKSSILKFLLNSAYTGDLFNPLYYNTWFNEDMALLTNKGIDEAFASYSRHLADTQTAIFLGDAFAAGNSLTALFEVSKFIMSFNSFP